MGFAISATSQDASTTIRLIQESIKSFIDTYGATNMRYSLMTFGNSPSILTRFADKQSPEDLKEIIESAKTSSGKPDLENMFSEASKLFEEAGARPDAKKFLVVFLDNKSGNEKDDLIKIALLSTEQECWVIPVAVGENVDVDELEPINPVKNATVVVPKAGDPKKTAEEIADKMKERECTSTFILYHVI